MIAAAIALWGFVVFLWMLMRCDFELPEWLQILGGFCIIIGTVLAFAGLTVLAWGWLP